MFEAQQFIKPAIPFDPSDTGRCYAPAFRKRFFLTDTRDAVLHFCALGLGRVWLNGHPVGNEVFGTDESAYHKSLYYRSEPVSGLLRPGENVICVLCGNGFFNEIFPTSWDYDRARWRDHPKCIARLEVGGQTLLCTDGTWRCTVDTPIVYNQFRAGERYDARLAQPFWEPGFDDSAWPFAAVDTTPPQGVFRPRSIPPVVAEPPLPAVAVHRFGDGRTVYDFGVNMAGYARLRVTGPAGQEVVLRYGEDFDGTHIQAPRAGSHYPVSEYQTDRVILSGQPLDWSPSFSYHGFRYIQLTGLDSPADDAVEAVSIHQDIAQVGSFACSHPGLNRLFAAGVQACYSNFVCKVTDCPTREKLGWANDLMSSAEQLLLHFDVGDFLRKHVRDSAESMLPDGSLSCIVPTDCWGYTWGNGPVSEGVLFELCYQLYRYTGDAVTLADNLPFLLRSLDHFRSCENGQGFCSYGLYDHAPPLPEGINAIPVPLINGALMLRLLRVTCLAARCAGDTARERALERRLEEYRDRFIGTYIGPDGRCTVDHMSAVALAIDCDGYRQLEPLKQQLKRLVEAAGFHHNCGMVGLRRLYDALTRCGLQEYAWRIITAEGFPGYLLWLEQGATTLWEMWNGTESHNHHMYSDFMGWLTRNIGGIQTDDAVPGMKQVLLQPWYPRELTWCRAESRGYRVYWHREGDGVTLEFTVPEGCRAICGGTVYGPGSYCLQQ